MECNQSGNCRCDFCRPEEGICTATWGEWQCVRSANHEGVKHHYSILEWD